MRELELSKLLLDWIIDGIHMNNSIPYPVITSFRNFFDNIMELGDEAERGTISTLGVVTTVRKKAANLSGNARYCDYVYHRSTSESLEILRREFPDLEARVINPPSAINRGSALLFSLALLSNDMKFLRDCSNVAGSLIECALILDDLTDWKEDLLLAEENSVNFLRTKFGNDHVVQLNLIFKERMKVLKDAHSPASDFLQDQFLTISFRYGMERIFSNEFNR